MSKKPIKSITREELTEKRYQDLIKLLPEFGLKYAFQKKAELIELILSSQKGVKVYVDTELKEEVSDVDTPIVSQNNRGFSKGDNVIMVQPIPEDADYSLDLAAMLNKSDGILVVVDVNQRYGVITVKADVESSVETLDVSDSLLAVVDKINPEGKRVPKKDVNAKTQKRERKIILSDSQKEIIDRFKSGETSSKSDAIRKLYRKGMKIGNIAKSLGINYSFAYCVADKFRKDHLKK